MPDTEKPTFNFIFMNGGEILPIDPPKIRKSMIKGKISVLLDTLEISKSPPGGSTVMTLLPVSFEKYIHDIIYETWEGEKLDAILMFESNRLTIGLKGDVPQPFPEGIGGVIAATSVYLSSKQ